MQVTKRSRGDDQAFPCPVANYVPGMTLREYLAGHAMVGLLSAETLDHNFLTAEDMANWAVADADALIEALEAKPCSGD